MNVCTCLNYLERYRSTVGEMASSEPVRLCCSLGPCNAKGVAQPITSGLSERSATNSTRLQGLCTIWTLLVSDLVGQPFPRHLDLTFANDCMNWAFGLFAV
jgi:hypothetical protein